jgi:hypothetical protein
MRGRCSFGVAVLLSIGTACYTSHAAAQTPVTAPSSPFKFSISGLIDQVTSYSRNMSMIDQNVTADKDREWYGRTRGRFDFIGEVGTAKGVLGLEVDMVYGQTGSNDSSIVAAGFPAAVTPVQTHFGTNGGFDLNTDVRAVLEVKWLYVEFEAPLVPLPTTVVLGAQPFDAMYKVGVYATGDFAGVRLRSGITRDIVAHFTYAQVEEGLAGRSGGIPAGQYRGNDFAIITSLEWMPLRGLALRPLYSFFYADGSTSFVARGARGGVTTGVNERAIFPNGSSEYRHTVGLDARWTHGGFYLDPTLLYQFGTREM